jgi:CBS domain-containing protein
VRRITGVTAEDIMTSPVKTASPEDDIEDLATLMVEQKANPVPVVDEEGQMIGIVSRTDLLRVVEELELALEKAERDAEQAEPGE